MTYKTLLVHVDNSERCTARIDLALVLARKFEAHLTGLYVGIPDVPAYPPGIGSGPVQKLLLEETDTDSREAAERFQSRVRGVSLPGVEWRSVRGYPEDTIGLHARYADLVMVGQPNPENRYPYPLDFPALLALTVTRPVLAIPYVGSNSIGQKVLVAWNGSREATRAITNALPLLKTAEKVTVMAVNPSRGPLRHGEVPGADLALYLARHGVTADVAYQEKIDIDVGEWLLSSAADLGVDLIVMGAYGHLRLREWVLGGATRTLVRSMTVPVLMSH